MIRIVGPWRYWLLPMLLGLCLPAVHAAVPLPDVPMGKAERCVEDTAYMRRNHMELLKHQRDETVHRGVRTKKHSLKGCLGCHAVKGADDRPVRIASNKHFCNTCHQYAAVRIDCFDCHASVAADEGL